MAIVKFNANEWLEVYPAFKDTLTEAQLNYAFKLACQLIDNTETSIIPYDPDNGIDTREIMLWLAVCHLATLALRPIGQAGSLTNATEGSVSTGFTLPNAVNGDYFMQSPCGQTLWQLMRRFMIGGRYYDLKKCHPWG